MLPVNNLFKNLRSERQKSRSTPAKTGAKNTSLSFNEQLMQQLNSTSQPTLRQELTQLQDLLDQAGDTLEKHPTLGNLEVFRALLSNLVGKVVKAGFQVDSVGPGWHPADRHQIVRKIDAEAEDLMHLVLSEQKDRIEIVRKLVSIKGLVIDLVS